MSISVRPRRRLAAVAALAGGVAAVAPLGPLPGVAPVQTAHAGALQQIAFEATPDALVTLGELASRTQRQPVTRAGLGPYTISGADSRTGQPYSFVTDEPYDPVSRAAYGNEGDEGIVSSTFDTARTIEAVDPVDNTRTNVLRLFSDSNCVNQNTLGGVAGYCSLFGPEVWSEPFTATAGQAVSFDWRASGASDDYEIYAFLVGVGETSPGSGTFDYGTDASHQVLAYGRGDTQGWTTTSSEVTAPGTYRFRFVNGTYDGTGGLALGSEMFIDSVVKLGLANTITFAPLGDRIVGDAPFALAATAPSGPVTYSSATPSICTVSGSTVTITGTLGVCTIVADQSGDGVDYVPASSVARSFRVLATATAPTNIGLPTIQGTPQAGRTVTATEGTWADGGSPITGIALQWRQTTGGVTTDLAGTTSASCFLVPAPGSSLSVTATATNAVGSTPASSTTIADVTCGTPPAPAVQVTFAAEAGDQPGSPDAAVIGAGSGLLPGSNVTLTLQPGGTVLGNATVASDGTFTTSVTIPAGLPSGSYSVVLAGTGWDGAPVLDTGWFALEVGGSITGVSETGPVSAGAGFAAVTPTRLLDTRQPGGAPVAAGSVTEIVVAGRGGVAADASAVVLNVTVDAPGESGFVTAYPCGTARPLASNVNYSAGRTIANAVTVGVGTGGKVCLFNSGVTDLVVDVNGGYSSTAGAGRLSGLVPARLLDTRDTGSKPASGSVQEVQVVGRGGVAAGATAVVLNVTATEPDAAGYLTVYPCGIERPLASNVNFQTGRTVANAVTSGVGTGGKVCVFTSTPTHLVVDVTGDYLPGRPAGTLAGTTIERLLDTRGAASPTAGSPVAAGSVTEIVVAGRGGVAVDASAVSLNVTVDAPTTAGFVTVFPCGTSIPLASNVNFVAGQTVSNAVTTSMGAAGKVCVYTMSTAHLVVDVGASFAGVPATS